MLDVPQKYCKGINTHVIKNVITGPRKLATAAFEAGAGQKEAAKQPRDSEIAAQIVDCLLEYLI